ncbi:hypothetical protein KQX54_003772 [Cotesia glomerata]|uniref:C2H2-type domain-containing protein n=1 Tax=Cotesia glomerata TaxID=32391 RepID=A0AAV7II33_COTGL|nr:hypothetical protein KQX54_003772 [Cotesia glomerata]
MDIIFGLKIFQRSKPRILKDFTLKKEQLPEEHIKFPIQIFSEKEVQKVPKEEMPQEFLIIAENKNQKEMELNLPRKKIVCPNKNCHCWFVDQKSLDYHLKHYCNLPKRFKCTQCEFKARFPSEIKIHTRRTHRKQKIPDKRPLPNILARKGFLLCTNGNCKEKFKNSYYLNLHLKYDCGKNGRFKCEYCEFQSSAERILKNHWLEEHPHLEYCIIAVDQV